MASVRKHPHDLVSYIAEKNAITRAAAHRHVRDLIHQGLLENLSHKKTRPNYQLKNRAEGQKLKPNTPSKKLAALKEFEIKITPEIFEDTVWRERLAPLLSGVPENVLQICQYGFTEIFNNVIDHSTATLAKVTFRKQSNLVIEVSDNGVGIFKKILAAENLSSFQESVLYLSKGKFTTDPSRHSGQGIFFSSRAFDLFTIASDKLSFIRSGESDWYLEDNDRKEPGTYVQMQINVNSSTRLDELFQRYTSEDDMAFAKTHALVALAKFKEENFISRSQAKRLLLNLEKFLVITFDFKGVTSVGQGFVDEVFRVFQNDHPTISLDFINANENVTFMIKRGL